MNNAKLIRELETHAMILEGSACLRDGRDSLTKEYRLVAKLMKRAATALRAACGIKETQK